MSTALPCYALSVLPLAFTFLDGAFRYDCPTCGQACCRGKGIAIDASRELVPLVARAPALAPLVTPLSGGYVRLPDATDGCWFLRDDGMCRYEEKHGREAKFLTCRLFPFNRIFRVGNLRIVDFNSVVCPLQDAYGTGNGVTYRELTAEIQSGGDSPLVNTLAELPEGARELRWHALEQGLLEASAVHLEAPDYIAYAEFQSARTQRHLGEVRPSDDAGLFALVEMWQRLYGIQAKDETWQKLSAQTARAMTLLTPSLRFNALFKRGAGPYRQQVAMLPQKLLASWFLSTLAAFAVSPAPAALSLRSITEFHQAQAPLRDLLARFGEPAALDRPLAAPDMPDAVAAAVRAMSLSLSETLLSPRVKKGAPASRLRGPILGSAILQAATDHGLSAPLRALLPSLLLRADTSLRFA